MIMTMEMQMKRTVTVIALITFFTAAAFSNRDTLSLLELSGKLVQKGGEPFKAYRVELRSGEELLNTIYSGRDEKFTLLLKRNMQYSMRIIADGRELKNVFINTNLPWEEINKTHHFDLDIEFPEKNSASYKEEAAREAGSVNFDPGTRSFSYTNRQLVEAEEEDFDITKPKY
jgi:hypothetical protein